MKKSLIGSISVVLIITSLVYLFRQKDETVPPVELVVTEQASSGLAQKQVMLGSTVYTLDIADTDLLQEKGLSFRENLSPQTGMLFIFGTPDVYQFWMKDMKFAIDMIWLDADKKVVYIEEFVDPSTYPQSFGPETPTQYVIEIPAGDTTKVGLKVGDLINF